MTYTHTRVMDGGGYDVMYLCQREERGRGELKKASRESSEVKKPLGDAE